jgi:hypothetical protein
MTGVRVAGLARDKRGRKLQTLPTLLGRATCIGLALGLAACGGGGSGGSGASDGGGNSNRPQAQVLACAGAAGLSVKVEKFDAAFDETGQIGLTSIGNTITITFFKDESEANQYYKISGGAKNPGAEPGGNEQIGKAMLAFYAKDQALKKAEACTRP